MILSALVLLVFETSGTAQAAVDPAQIEAPALAPLTPEALQPEAPKQEITTTVIEGNDVVEKKIIYKKETTVDLTGTTVDGENQLPPAFFVTKMQTPGARSLLEERLRFGLRDYNHMGF